MRDVEEKHKKGQPILLGTISVEKSESPVRSAADTARWPCASRRTWPASTQAPGFTSRREGGLSRYLRELLLLLREHLRDRARPLDRELLDLTHLAGGDAGSETRFGDPCPSIFGSRSVPSWSSLPFCCWRIDRRLSTRAIAKRAYFGSSDCTEKRWS